MQRHAQRDSAMHREGASNQSGQVPEDYAIRVAEAALHAAFGDHDDDGESLLPLVSVSAFPNV